MTGHLVRAGTVVTRFTAEGAETIEDGAILIEVGAVAAVGRWENLRRAHPALPVLGGPDAIAIPGLVNAHHHVGVTPFQLGVSDLPLELWALARWSAREVDPYLDTLAGAFDLIGCGVTTVQHIVDLADGPPEAIEARLAAVLRAYGDVGLRASVGYGLADQGVLWPGHPDAETIAGLPAELRRPVAEALGRVECSPRDALAVTRALADRLAGHPRLAVQLAPSNPQWCSDAALAAVAEVSEAWGMGVHLHLLETPRQRDAARVRAPAGALAHLDALGLLTPRLTVGHGVWMTDGEVALLAARGGAVCVCCSSNLRLRSGLAPFRRLLAAGVEVAVGIDEAGLGDDRDMWLEMRLLHALHRGVGVTDDGPSPGRILRAATEGGARTTPFAESVGTLLPGKRADLVLLDRRALAGVHLAPDQPLADALLRRAGRRSVTSVICEGEVIWSEGRPSRVDAAAILDELRTGLDRPPDAAECARRSLASRLVATMRERFDA